MKKINLLTSIIFFMSLLFLSCQKEETLNLINEGELVFGFSNIENTKNLNSKNENSKPVAVLVSIKNKLGETIYSFERIELFNINNKYISAPIPLKIGEYKLTDFLIIDNNNKVLYAAPKEGSSKAYLVNNPLPIGYIISKNQVNKIIPEVISTENLYPEDFGYNTFSFEIIKTLDFLVGIFKYDNQVNNFQLTDANIQISNNNIVLFNKHLDAITNLITLNANYSKYIINVSKPGYTSYHKEFSRDSLIKHLNKPLVIILNANNDSLIIQPGSEGIDAMIWSCLPNNPNPKSTNFQAMAWTWNSFGYGSGIRRSLLKFDLSQIPQNAEIVKAELSLFYNVNHIESTGGHSSLSGSNQAVIERITSDWQEDVVTWNNQPTTTTESSVILQQSSSNTQDYTNIDITNMVKLMVSDQANNFGMMLKLSNEAYYRCLLFASSDHPNAELHPKLVIYYE